MIAERSALQALFTETAFRQPEDSIGFLLWRVAHRYQREIDRTCADLGLTHLQFVALVLTAWLGREDVVVSQASLAAFSGIHPMQVSSVLAALEEKGLVDRSRSGRDVRRKRIAVTEAGLLLLNTALPLVEAAQRRFFGADQMAGGRMHAALRDIVESWAAEAASGS